MYYRLPYEEQRLSVQANPMCEAFPRIAACDYHRFGSGGLQEKVNAICILALNVINDKVSCRKIQVRYLYCFPFKHPRKKITLYTEIET